MTNARTQKWRRCPSRPVTSRLSGFTLIEVLLAAAITAVLLTSLGSVVTNSLDVNDEVRLRNALTRDARFAMGRMIRAVNRTRVLLVPMAEDPNTMNSESLIEPGLLAVSLDPYLDRDLDGFSDADNDRDGLVDEDLPRDSSNDGKPGIIGIDDDNSGIADFSFAGDRDDDETGFIGDEDPIDGADNDGDGAIDEDPPADMNGDGAPGVAGVDDDGDGLFDEGNPEDDDEDGTSDEDWYDVVVYFLSGTDLIERTPDLDPNDGTDFTERVIAENVSLFRVERRDRGSNRADLVEISIEVSQANASVALTQRTRVGGAL